MKRLSTKIISAIMSFSAIVSMSVNSVSAVGENTSWDFSAYAESAVSADTETVENYEGLEIHLNSGDSIGNDGLHWSSPGTTTSDSKSVENNRYMVFTPESSGTLSVTFSGNKYASKSKAPRMYIVSGENASCMSKTNSDENGKAATATAANKETTVTIEADKGKVYYIWPYYYNDSSCNFTVTNVTYNAAVPEMKTRNIYESNMLLQRDEPVYIDGICSVVVETATAKLYSSEDNYAVPIQTKDITVNDRKWNVTFDAVSDYEKTYKMVFSTDGMEDIVYENILFGDQYIFSGQSNMWMTVNDYKNIDKDAYGEAAVKPHLTDKIRLMYTPGKSDYGTAKLQFDAQNKQAWRDFSSYANIRDVGAPAFSAAIKIHEETGVPIGVINNAYPGSYISSWFDSALAIDNCNLGKNGTSNERNWYCGRIYPLRNLELSGVFWYQGCADAATTYHSNPYEYYMEMQPKLIDSWRKLFGDEELPFYYTQLSRIGSTIVDENNPDTGSAGKMPIKRAQTDIYTNMENRTNVGVVSTLDLYGNYDASGSRNCRTDIHLAQKQFVGNRMAALALSDIYNKTEYNDGSKLYRMGPIYKSSAIKGNSIVVTFECNGRLSVMPSSQYTDSIGVQKVESGEINPNVLNEFELAGEDGIWYAAAAEITADNQVTVTSDAVTNPVSVRYCGSDYPESPNLTDESGLPSYVFSKNAETTEPADPTQTPATESPSPTAIPTMITKIIAEYDKDGRLTSILSDEIYDSEIETSENTQTHKVFYWNSFDTMVPVTVPTAEVPNVPVLMQSLGEI